PNLREYPKGEDIMAALSRDRYGVAYTGLAYRTTETKPIVVGTADGEWVPLTRDTVASRRYPLIRSVYIYIDPGQLENAKVREFLTYVLSKEGQEDVANGSGYLPLTPAEASVQRKKLTSVPAQPL
ncbi:MAG: phosphate transporter substrate-binding protein, partial [Verrucomicrobia bacterium]|nr:phosphate transporter substrate-binding protein [Verrucomicrobiota bacterium]